MRNKKKKSIDKLKLLILIIAVIMIIIAIILTTLLKKESSTSNNEIIIDMDANPIVYYIPYNASKIILQEDDEFFAMSIAITWDESCKGKIIKDGKAFSEERGVMIVEDGNYEITVTSPQNGSIVRNITIDKTAPKVEVEKKSDGTYTISFDDVGDVETAMLYKFDNNIKKYKELSNLKENGLKQEIQIIEEGTYSLRCTDKLNNMFKREFRINKK